MRSPGCDRGRCGRRVRAPSACQLADGSPSAGPHALPAGSAADPRGVRCSREHHDWLGTWHVVDDRLAPAKRAFPSLPHSTRRSAPESLDRRLRAGRRTRSSISVMTLDRERPVVSLRPVSASVLSNAAESLAGSPCGGDRARSPFCTFALLPRARVSVRRRTIVGVGSCKRA